MKRCGKPAAWVMVDDPTHPCFFCKKHGPEEALKKAGVQYVKARPGEKCGQLADWKAAMKEVLFTFFTTGSIPKVIQRLQDLYKGKD